MRIKHLLCVLGAMLSLTMHAVAQESATLRKIKESGIISIGFRDASIPFSYLDKQQRPIGYSIDLCYRIVDAIKTKMKLPGLEVMLRPVTPGNRISFVVNDIIDLECGSTTNNIERQRDVAFSVTTFVASGSLVSKKSSAIESLQDLKGMTVASTAGTTYMKALADANRMRRLEMRIISGRDHAESFHLVETDRAAAFVMDDVLLHGLVALARDPAAYAIHNVDLSAEPYGLVIRKNDPEFKKVVDEAIVDLFRSGDIQQIYRKWFLAPIPASKINLQLPMSPALRKAIAVPTDSGDPAEYR